MLDIQYKTFALLILGTYLLVFAVIPLTLTLIEKFFQFILRDNKFQTPSFTWYISERKSRNTSEWIVSGILFFVVLFIILTILGGVLSWCQGVPNLGGVTINLGWLLILVIPHSLRFVADLCRNLKMNHKTGDAEALTKLQEEVESLKKSIDKK